MEIDKGYVNIAILFLFGLFLIYKGITSLSSNGKQLEKMLIDKDIYIISNSFCKCKDVKIKWLIYFIFKCDLCRIKRVIDFEEEKDIFYLLENIKSPAKFIIHTEGGDSELSSFLAYIINQNNIKLETYIPQYALSAGSFIALCSEKLYLNWYSSMSPVDTQVEYSTNSDDEDESFPAKHIQEVVHKTNAVTRLRSMEASSFHKDDIYIINSMFRDKRKRGQIIKNFLETDRSHAMRYGPKDLKRFGLNVETEMPEDITNIFNIFRKLK